MTGIDLDALDSYIDRLETHYLAAGQGPLPPGLSENEISVQERALGWRLPTELRRVYSRHANYRLSESPFALLPVFLPESVENTLIARGVYSSMADFFAGEEMVTPWRDSLIVMINRGHANFVFLDCDALAERAGQIYHIDETFQHTPTFPSLTEAFRCWVRQLDTGYKYPVPARNGDVVVWETNEDNWPPDLPRSSHWLWQ